MPKEWAAILGIVIGGMLVLWSVFMLIRRFRMTEEQKARSARLWIILLLGLMGLGELSGSIRKLMQYLT